MKIEHVNVAQIIAQGREMLKNNKKITAEFATLFLLVLTLLELMFERFGKNSRNSSIPPSQDPNRDKTAYFGRNEHPFRKSVNTYFGAS